jgi:putative ABC transport system permease protein
MALREDIKHAIRMEFKKPKFAFLVILTLALGIGANTAIFSVINAVLLSALPYRDPDRLVMLLEHDSKVGGKPVAYLNFLDWRRMTQTLSSVACYRGRNSVILGNAGADRVPSKWVSGGFFRTLGVSFEMGRDFTSAEDAVGGPPVVVIGDEVWRRHFNAETDVLGRTLNIEGVSRTVIGVLRPDFQFAGDAQVFLPIHSMAFQEPRYNHDALYVVGRMKAGVTIEKTASEMKLIAAQLETQYPKENAGETIDVIPLDKWFAGNSGEVSLLLLWAVGLVLLLACVNVAGLFLARLGERRREFAVRAALGAQRGQMIRQTLVESLVLALQGGLVGLLLAGPFLGTLAVFVAPEQLEAVRMDFRVIAFNLLLSCLTAVAFGLFPALTTARVDLSEGLRDRDRSVTAGHHRFRDVLVVSQVALALILLIGSGLMIRTVWSLLSVETGIRPEGVVTLQIQGPETRFTSQSQTAKGFDIDKYVTLWKNYDTEVLRRVQALPGVESAAMTFPLVFTGATARIGIQFEGQKAASETKVLHRYSVSPDYFKVMGIRLIKGRGFTMADDWRKPNVAILNATAARLYSSDRDPVGRRFVLPDLRDWGSYTVVGVVADTLHDSLSAPPPPQIYLSFLQWPSVIIMTIRTPVDPATMANAVRRKIAEFDKEAPVYEVHAMQDHLTRVTSYARRIAVVLSVLAGLALLLASVGIYAVMAQVVIQRRHEIGVRIAIGASPSGVLKMVLGRAMLLAGIGTAVGLFGAFASARVLERWLVGVTSTDPLTYASLSLLLAVVALIATYWPARRAASTDPIAALRCE